MNQNQFMEAKKQLEEERERLQKRVQELDELINDEKEILMKKVSFQLKLSNLKKV